MILEILRNKTKKIAGWSLIFIPENEQKIALSDTCRRRTFHSKKSAVLIYYTHTKKSFTVSSDDNHQRLGVFLLFFAIGSTTPLHVRRAREQLFRCLQTNFSGAAKRS